MSLSNIQQDYLEIFFLRMFLVDKFLKREITRKKITEVLFSSEKLDGTEYLAFEEEEIILPVHTPEKECSGLDMLINRLDQLSEYIYDGTFTIDQIMIVMFSKSYITKDRKIEFY